MPDRNTIPYSEFVSSDLPYMDLIGLRTCMGDDGHRRMVLRLERRHLNGLSNAHGGIILAMLDVALASACRVMDQAGRSCVTVEMKTSFMRPGGVEGETIEALGIVRHVTRSLAFCDGELRNETGELLATASGTFKYLNQTATASDG